ncbi:hypothetical protein FA13DRAFT_421004 [Coprinellus micaceus]|uniref:RRM domain-containing protein n=1 Tax=Coprinellus micaceus TaxID=71717 RepID=A0A4Y7TY99_COPMI|nr:hypothetical protein FA13DRAFT_421004 [Coprinellus micaceus]
MGRASASDDTAAPSSPRTSSPLSLFARPSSSNTPRSAHHARSASLSTLHMPSSFSLALASPSSPTPKNKSPAQPSPAPPSNSKWRPSILDHFSHSSQSSFVPPEATYTPPRPSLSSGETSMSGNSTTKTATTMDSDMPPTPSRPSFLESLRSKNRSSLSIFKSQVGSSTSICSPSRGNFDDIPEAGPSSANPSGLLSPTDPRRMSPFAYSSRGQYDNLLDDDEDLDCDQQHYVASQALPPPTLPTHHKRESARSSISFSSHFGSIGSKAQRRKKRLVISGVGVHETRKFEGVKRWCENFGEIRQITRVANGDLHIDFRRPEVADTVRNPHSSLYARRCTVASPPGSCYHQAGLALIVAP